MDHWESIARGLEQNRNEVKWQASVDRAADALRAAYSQGFEDGRCIHGHRNRVAVAAAESQPDGFQ